MLIASSLVLSLWLGIVAAGIVPIGKDGPCEYSTSMTGSGIRPQLLPSASPAITGGSAPFPSGSSDGSLIQVIPTFGTLAQSPPARRGGVNPTFVHSVHPVSRRAKQTDDIGSPVPTHTSTQVSAHPLGLAHATPSGSPSDASGAFDHHLIPTIGTGPSGAQSSCSAVVSGSGVTSQYPGTTSVASPMYYTTMMDPAESTLA